MMREYQVRLCVQ